MVTNLWPLGHAISPTLPRGGESRKGELTYRVQVKRTINRNQLYEHGRYYQAQPPHDAHLYLGYLEHFTIWISRTSLER
jgi:hypothetical protein